MLACLVRFVTARSAGFQRHLRSRPAHGNLVTLLVPTALVELGADQDGPARFESARMSAVSQRSDWEKTNALAWTTFPNGV